MTGAHVRLEPLRPEHAPGLFAASDPQTFLYHLNVPDGWTPQAFARHVDRLIEMPDRVTLTMLDPATGEPIGSTAFLEIRPEHLGIEIGATWITPARRGTSVNPEAKLLMLTHAFDALGAIRVQLKCDGRNTHSQNAIARLGATREGVLRRHLRAPDGFMRDTVYYSILAEEWPRVRQGLHARLWAKGN
jgi:RimJ/RimL family protein N-acetyltransferase